MTIWIITLIYFSLLFLYIAALILLFKKLPKDKPAAACTQFPSVSILIAARNEENNIISCLEAIHRLSYPAAQYEVLVGNDQSTDRTEVLVKAYIEDKPSFRIINIEESAGGAKGKANVLAQLARQARGDFFYITDADIQVPASWIQSLMANHTESTGIVSGATKVSTKSVFDICQLLDWVYAFGMVKVVSDHNIPVSAVGNNMMISRKAYESTGGYENIPFSVTEDLELFLQTLKRGWKFKNLMSPDSLALTSPIASISDLFAQRKRWMRGAIRLPWILLLCLFIQSLFLPALILAFICSPTLAIILWIFKIAGQQYFMYLSFRRIGEKYYRNSWWLFELYSTLFSLLVVLNYLLPGKVVWKERKY